MRRPIQSTAPTSGVSTEKRSHDHSLTKNVLDDLKDFISEDRPTRIREIQRRLKIGQWMPDVLFDSLYDPLIRSFSNIHWTPVHIAISAGKLISDAVKDTKSSLKILDIGSGCGKAACVMGAYINQKLPHVSIVGIEQRSSLVQASMKIVQDLQLEGISFREGNVFDHHWSAFDCIYFYNPFYEHKSKDVQMLNDVGFSDDAFDDYIEETSTRLKRLRKGTLIVTYHGFGGKMPAEYRLLHASPGGSDTLRIWVKEKR